MIEILCIHLQYSIMSILLNFDSQNSIIEMGEKKSRIFILVEEAFSNNDKDYYNHYVIKDKTILQTYH